MGIVDITAPDEPVLSARLKLDGSLVASRRIGETLYLVTRHAVRLPAETAADGGDISARIHELSLSELLPDWSYDGESKGDLFDADSCFLLPGAADNYVPQMVSVTAVDLRAPDARPASTCLVGSAETVYASTESLYVATSRYQYADVPLTGGGSVTTVAASSTTDTDVEPGTAIHKFALESSGPEYRGSGRVVGTLGVRGEAAFRMSDYRGILRVASSTGNTWDGTAETHLTLLKEDNGELVETAHLPNENRRESLGKDGESLYAVRFAGDRAFLVTFQEVDPLYVIDLSNPEDPKILGELEMPGYSDYLHPVSDSLVLGIGKDAIASEDGTFSWYQGVKLALFDVSDPTALSVVDSLIIGERGTESEVLVDHHALAPADRQPAGPAGRSGTSARSRTGELHRRAPGLLRLDGNRALHVRRRWGGWYCEPRAHRCGELPYRRG